MQNKDRNNYLHSLNNLSAGFMIIVKLSGGLGNQMFQYAFGRYLADKNKTSLVLSTSFLQSKLPFKKWATQMRYELNIFNIKAALKSNYLSSNIITYPLAKTEYWLRTNYYKSKYSLLLEKEFNFNPEYLTAKDSTYVEGNFQSEKYFKSIAETIRQDFIFKNPLDQVNEKWKEQITGTNSVSVHIRRGDYISIKRNAQKFSAVPLAYYSDAIKLITRKIDNPTFFVFSDDLEWVKENLHIDAPAYFVTNNSNPAYIDMQLMSLCKHNIIANSTFSWWAAWLNANVEKTVIAPEKWFADVSINSQDIIPDEWIKL